MPRPEIAMPAPVRTALRRMLRSHPDITRHVDRKSDVNSLPGDQLIALADRLDIDFVRRLKDEVPAKHEFWALNSTYDPMRSGREPFQGTLELDIGLSVLGHTGTTKLRVHYQYTPMWQYYCPHDHRLKHRGAGSIISYEIQRAPLDEEEITGPDGSLIPREVEWHDFNDGADALQAILRDPIDQEIERRSRQEDADRRRAAGVRPGDPEEDILLHTQPADAA